MSSAAIKRFPMPVLRGRLSELGVPADQHDAVSLSKLLPVGGVKLEKKDPDVLAEIVVYMIQRKIIAVDARAIFENLQWGDHFCQIYDDFNDLLKMIVPFLKKGMRNNEACVWIVPEGFSPAAARASLEAEGPLPGGKIEILRHRDWYLDSGGGLKADSEILAAWQRKLAEAVEQGYDGLRVTGDGSWVAPADWRSFLRYEEKVHEGIGGLRMKALCTYAMEGPNIKDVVGCHGPLVVRGGSLVHVIPNGDRKATTAIIGAFCKA